MEPINWYGTFTLTKREVKRFLRVYHQSVVTPVVNALIFLSIFTLALEGKDKQLVSGIRFVDFMGYGLIIMSIVQNAFANSSSSFVMSKIIGYITDILVPPLGSIELIIAFTLGALARGTLVGISVTIALSPFIHLHLQHPLWLCFYIFASCSMLGMIGMICGMWARTFDQYSVINSYVVTPLSFLSGTFYSVKQLPAYVQYFNLFNPFFYIVDGFRYCFTNHADGDIHQGALVLIAINILVFFGLKKLLDIGWRIKG